MLAFAMFDFLNQIDVVHLTKTAGYVGLTLIILCETGIFLGFFLPGDSLLFAAGLLAAQGLFNIFILTPLLIAAAFLGYAIAYWFGDKIGHWLLSRPESIWCKRKYLLEAHKFYEKHGGKALILGRLVPIIRTFLPIVAGMAEMSQQRYNTFNMIGAVLWCGGITVAGYFLGGMITNIDRYILPIILGVVLLSLLPPLIHILRVKIFFKYRKVDVDSSKARMSGPPLQNFDKDVN